MIAMKLFPVSQWQKGGLLKCRLVGQGKEGKRVGEKAGNEEQINGPGESENNSR